MGIANPCKAGTASKFEVAKGQAAFYAGFDKSATRFAIVHPIFAGTLSWTAGTHYVHF